MHTFLPPPFFFYWNEYGQCVLGFFLSTVPVVILFFQCSIRLFFFFFMCFTCIFDLFLANTPVYGPSL